MDGSERRPEPVGQSRPPDSNWDLAGAETEGGGKRPRLQRAIALGGLPRYPNQKVAGLPSEEGAPQEDLRLAQPRGFRPAGASGLRAGDGAATEEGQPGRPAAPRVVPDQPTVVLDQPTVVLDQRPGVPDQRTVVLDRTRAMVSEQQRRASPAPRRSLAVRLRPWLVSIVLVGLVGAAATVWPLLTLPGAGSPRPTVGDPSPAPIGTVIQSSDASVTPAPAISGSALTSPAPSGPDPSVTAPSATAAAPVPPAAAPGTPKGETTASGPTASPSAKPAGRANTTGRNLAAGRPTLASSEQNAGWGPTNAVDGDTATRWSSAAVDPQWIRVDLGEAWLVNEVTLFWEAAYATAYRVDISRDGVNWTTAYQTSRGSGGVALVPIGGKAARYLRVMGTQRATVYGYSLFEFEVR